MLPDIHRRIVNAKYIFERATGIQTEDAEMSLSIALLLAHDAIELLMLAVLAQDMQRQMLHPYPRQDQEARVVSDKSDAAAPRRGIPADVEIATKMARSR